MRNKRSYNLLSYCLHRKTLKNYQFSVKNTNIYKYIYKRRRIQHLMTRGVAHINLAVCKCTIMHINNRYLFGVQLCVNLYIFIPSAEAF